MTSTDIKMCISSSAQLTHYHSQLFFVIVTQFLLLLMCYSGMTCCIYQTGKLWKAMGFLYFSCWIYLCHLFLLVCVKHATWSDLTIFSLIGRNSPDQDHNFFSWSGGTSRMGENLLIRYLCLADKLRIYRAYLL